MYDHSTLTLGYKLRSFYVNICGFILQWQRTIHLRRAFPERRIKRLRCFLVRAAYFPAPHSLLPSPSLLLLHAHSASKVRDVAMVMSTS